MFCPFSCTIVGPGPSPHSELLNLKGFHRQQLRKVVSLVYPHKIPNDKLYDRTKTSPLRFHLLRSRWRPFGHIIRRSAGIPAYRFMSAYFIPSEVTDSNVPQTSTVPSPPLLWIAQLGRT
ncbi:hypothetical protein PC121_g10334 [Phytophthora cactorum]|nr:hypothetical protein PC120_g8062 [Phytophthora cactorum]KAG3068080.1 hypothetical protein PC121_g10334 [Phytophthora cactorum]